MAEKAGPKRESRAETAAPREVRIGRVLNANAGCMTTRLAFAEVDGRKCVVKSLRSVGGTMRYANLESDILASALFAEVGIRAPRTEVVRLARDSALRETLGEFVAVQEFVDERFAGGKVLSGAQGNFATDEGLLTLFAMDLLIGNADRRTDNLFFTEGGEPIPVDHNSAFRSALTDSTTTGMHINFVRSMRGFQGKPVNSHLQYAGAPNYVMRSASIYAGLASIAPEELSGYLRPIVERIQERLTDQRIDAIVDSLPRHIIPTGITVDLRQPWSNLMPEGAAQVILGANEGKVLEADALFAARKTELKAVLKWRRDHLAAAF